MADIQKADVHCSQLGGGKKNNLNGDDAKRYENTPLWTQLASASESYDKFVSTTCFSGTPSVGNSVREPALEFTQ